MARHSLTNSMRTHTNLERGDIKVLLRCVLVVRSPGGLAPKQQAELEAAATLHLETIKTELGISDDVHVVYLKSRQSNIALPNVGHERQFGLKSLGEALVATQRTHLNVVALSYTGLTTYIGSLRSWCSQVAKQVESFSISEGITSSGTTFCMSTEGKEQRKGAEMSSHQSSMLTTSMMFASSSS
ncbi:hypothetical protein D6D24_04492 [Aureobasidium pullulans]|uniref:Uncharacterized protein n=1 Tax=Aureobasidium pullulans TaxID=5580 RepID=A0A4S8TXT1_AURPU|nr:hypothetical protein D6D26_09681 [Aureobasidium pullulans]THW16349.1 hypothetical protein D6D24_04492 [Aureobasidium pullulans]